MAFVPCPRTMQRLASKAFGGAPKQHVIQAKARLNRVLPELYFSVALISDR